VITDTELNAIAALAIMGLKTTPKDQMKAVVAYLESI
jgi:hypothetical protein